MKGRNFITVVGIAVMLVSMNAMAQDAGAKQDDDNTFVTTYSGKMKSKINPITYNMVPDGYVKADKANDGSNGGPSNKVAMINCTHPAPAAVQILDKFVKPVMLANYATKVYRDQIAANTTIATTYITNKANTDQLFWNGVLSNSMAPYILSVMYGGNGGYGSNNGYSGMYAGGLYGSYGNISYASLGAAANHPRF